jgi:CheY-like chemotaxis protein
MWPRSSRTVLIVSENRHEPTLDSAFLHQPNIRLLTGYPDGDGLKLARRKRPALIIENLCTTDRHGLEFCRELRSDRRTRAIPLILVIDPELHAEAGDADVDALLDKPLVRREYFNVVRRFVPLPKRRTQRAAVNLRFTYRLEGRTGQAFTRDISQNGAFLKSDVPASLGSRMEVEFSLPGAWDPLNCEAIVRSSPQRIPHHSQTGFGIEFDGMSDEDADRLEEFIDHHNDVDS